jgi:hypothetical protein
MRQAIAETESTERYREICEARAQHRDHQMLAPLSDRFSEDGGVKGFAVRTRPQVRSQSTAMFSRPPAEKYLSLVGSDELDVHALPVG